MTTGKSLGYTRINKDRVANTTGLTGNPNYTKIAGSGSTGSGGSGSRGSGSGYTAAAAAPAATGGTSSYTDQLSQLYAAQLAAQQAARQAAYDSAVQQQRSLYDQNVGRVNSAADKALQEAYLNRMLSQKNLGQQMSAQGLTGGATESVLGSLENSYGNSRNSIETGRQDNLADLLTTYQNNLSQARAALESGRSADYAEYITDLTKLAAGNLPASASLTQGSGTGEGVLLSRLQELLRAGSPSEETLERAAGGSGSYLSAYLNALGLG